MSDGSGRYRHSRDRSSLKLKIERDYNDLFDDLPPSLGGAHAASTGTMREEHALIEPLHVEAGITLREIVDGLLDAWGREAEASLLPDGTYEHRKDASTKRQPTSSRLEFFLRCAMIELENALAEDDDTQSTYASALILIAASHSSLAFDRKVPSPLIGAAREALAAFKGIEPDLHGFHSHEAAWTPMTRANWARKIREEIAHQLHRAWPPFSWTPDGNVPVPQDEWPEWADHEAQFLFDVVVRSMRFMVDAPELQKLAVPSNVSKCRTGAVRTLQRYFEENRTVDAETAIRKVLTSLGYPSRSAYSLWEADSVKSKRDARKPSSE